MKSSMFVTVLALVVACTPQESKTARDVSVRVAEDACKEVQDAGLDSSWVNLACTIVGAAGVVNVLLPRTEWHAIKARKAAVDAGPGK